MLGPLDRGDFVALAYRLGREAWSGRLTLGEDRLRHELWILRGYVVHAELEGHWAPLPQTLRDALAAGDRQAVSAQLARQLTARLERLSATPLEILAADPDARHPAASEARVALALWARRHAEGQLDATRVREVGEAWAGHRLAVNKLLLPDETDPSQGCDDTDRRMISALASPRRLDEIERVARAPRLRVLAFVHFLARVGALAEAPRPLVAQPAA